ncbi:MAG: DUF3298 domain-containing protein [Cellulosilyticaceae bacterium]
MKSEKDLEQIKKEYLEIPIPKELETRVEEAIKIGLKKKRSGQMKWAKITTGMAAALVLTINISPTFADTLSGIPVIGNIINVINFREYKVEGDRQQANISVPQVEGLANKELQDELNKELEAQADKTYEDFIAMAKEWEEVDSVAHYNVDMNYEVLTDTEEVFVLRVNKVESMASTNQEVKFYVIDKKSETALTLPSLFKDDTYVSVINEYLIGEMKGIMAEDESKVYWMPEDEMPLYEGIKPDQKFYINNKGELVIHFDKYEAGPGSTGESNFVIPTEEIADLLVNRDIIK